jgi:pimeloyl-ACP methyl ester carboxylesterase
MSSAPRLDFISVAGRSIQLMVGGSGPPLLYLHSAGGETEWPPLVDRLADHFEVYLPAHPGFAGSEGLDSIHDIHDLTWHVVDLCDQLGLVEVPVLGFSLGAWIAAELAILRPALVSRMLLVAAAGLHVDGAPMGDLFIDDLEALRRLMFFDPEHPAARQTLPSSLDDPDIIHWLRAREATARVGWNPYLHDPRLPRHLHRISCPTRLLWGREDRLIPVAHGEAYARLIPAATLRVLERCGHMLPWECPDAFLQEAVTALSGDPPHR